MRFLRHLLILALLILAIWHLRPHFGDLRQIPNLLKGANYSYLSISAVLIVGQYFGDGWLSKILLEISGRKINLKQTIKIAAIDVFAAHILPIGETGVVAASAYFYKRVGATNRDVIFLTVSWILTTNIVFTVLLISSLALLPKLPNIPIHVSDIAKIAIILILVLLTLVVVFRKKLLKILFKSLTKFSILSEIKKFITNLTIHKRNIIKNKTLAPKAILAAFIYYATNIASLYFCFLAFGFVPSIPLVATAYLLSLIAAAITLAPAGIGASEATMILIFLQFGMNPALATASVLAFRIFAFWLPIPAGALSYSSLRKNSD